ncbi:MAG: hypothetical protein JO264_13250 [Acidisphaera sp.]|nr:hypothetical protein [Acidisphaera sp.]
MPTPATHVSKPSVARRVTLDDFVPVPRGAQSVPTPPLAWPAKDPADVLDYELDIRAALAGNEGDSIATLDVTIAPDAAGDLTLNSATADGTVAVLWLAAGQAGTTYTVTIAIGTAEGRSLSRAVLLPVTSLSSVANAPSGLTTDTGTVLTDQTGNPIVVES